MIVSAICHCNCRLNHVCQHYSKKLTLQPMDILKSKCVSINSLCSVELRLNTSYSLTDGRHNLSKLMKTYTVTNHHILYN